MLHGKMIDNRYVSLTITKSYKDDYRTCMANSAENKLFCEVPKYVIIQSLTVQS